MTETDAIAPARRGVIEQGITRAFPLLAGGLAASPALLAVPGSDEPLAIFTVQLSVIVALGLVVTVRIMPLADGAWFAGYDWSLRARLWAAAAVLVVLPTGVVGLLTLASSAALRFDPSLQFLQLLSALDIAWAGAALMVGTRWLWGRTAALVAGGMLGILCVLSVWNYLRVVGFGPDGSWVVRADEMMTLILPFDTAAAVMAIASLIGGIRRRAASGQPGFEAPRPR